MPKNMLAAGVLLAAFSFSASAQPARGKATNYDTGDFTVGNLKFHRAGSGFIQVVDTAKNETAGTVIVTPGGAPVFAPMPGYDIKAAYEKHMNEASASTASSNSPSTGKDESAGAKPSPPPSAAASYDAASKTVSLSGGRSVKFIDNDNAEVSLPGAAGNQIYELHYHKASAGGFGKGLARYGRGGYGAGSGIAGPLSGGVEIDLAGTNGMPGGKLYDTSDGASRGMQDASTRIKPIIDAVREASEVAKTDNPDIPKQNVIRTLLNNNLVR